MTALALASFKSNELILHEIKTDEKFHGYACNMTYMADYCKTSKMQRDAKFINFFKIFSDEVAFIILPGQLPTRKYFFRKCRCIMGNEVQSICLSWL